MTIARDLITLPTREQADTGSLRKADEWLYGLVHSDAEKEESIAPSVTLSARLAPAWPVAIVCENCEAGTPNPARAGQQYVREANFIPFQKKYRALHLDPGKHRPV